MDTIEYNSYWMGRLHCFTSILFAEANLIEELKDAKERFADLLDINAYESGFLEEEERFLNHANGKKLDHYRLKHPVTKRFQALINQCATLSGV